MKHIKSFKLFEGKTQKANDVKHRQKPWDINKSEAIRSKIEEHLKSLQIDYKIIGSDIAAKCCDDTIEIMFRKDYISVRKKGDKFTDEFEYSELGKVRKKITEICNVCSRNRVNESISSGELFRDMNTNLKNILNQVVKNYNVPKEEASKALGSYFTNNHWDN